MGIKNIHITLISASVGLCVIFGIWGLKNQYALLGAASLALSVCLAIYGINFIKKIKTA